MNLKISALLPPFALVLISACAHNVIMKPQTHGLNAGSYRSRMGSETGAMKGLSLQLNQNSRFTFATMEGGCHVTEEKGTWSVDNDVLSMKVEKTLQRSDCSSSWEPSARTGSDEELNCPIRNVTMRSFQLLHDEIGQGTVWTQWEMDHAAEHRLAND